MQRPATRIWICAFASTWALLGCRDRLPQRPDLPESTHTVYVVRRTWHIDIGFSAAELQTPLASVRTQFPSAQYLEFGFGDRHYLMSSHHGPGALMAALWPGPGLILMTALRAPPQQAFGADNVIELQVTARQLQQIQQFIWHSMTAVPETARVDPVASGPYPGSVFYAALPRYSALHTCNTWAAESLQSAQLPIRSTGVEFAGQLWSQTRHLQRSEANGTDR
jgi:hypothetical protein